jgi:hypothetical protein
MEDDSTPEVSVALAAVSLGVKGDPHYRYPEPPLGLCFMENMASSNDSSRVQTLVKGYTYCVTGTYKFTHDQLNDSKNIPYHAWTFLRIYSRGDRGTTASGPIELSHVRMRIDTGSR